MRKAICISLASCLSLASLPTSALTQSQGWFAGGGIGAGKVKVSSNTQRVYYTPNLYFDSYSTNQTKSTFPIASAEAGYHWDNVAHTPFAYFVGLRYRYLSADNMSGNVLVLNSTAFPYGFNYDTTAQTFSLFGKIDLIRMGSFAPYITGGIGGAILRFNDYTEYPKTNVSVPRDSAAFASDSSYNLTYDIGVGIDYYLTPNWTVSLGYDYINLGTLRTGDGAYNTLTGGTHALNFGEVTANTVFLQTDYMFNS